MILNIVRGWNGACPRDATVQINRKKRETEVSDYKATFYCTADQKAISSWRSV